MVSRPTLRPVRPDDEALLRHIYASTRADELALVDWSASEKAAFLRMQFDAQHRHYATHFPAASFDVVERDGRPIGRLYVDRREDEIRIIDIALLPEGRGLGIGGALLRALLDEAGRAGKPVRIHVERANPAMRLYRRLGFVEIADQGIYILMEWSSAASSESGLRGDEIR